VQHHSSEAQAPMTLPGGGPVHFRGEWLFSVGRQHQRSCLKPSSHRSSKSLKSSSEKSFCLSASAVKFPPPALFFSLALFSNLSPLLQPRRPPPPPPMHQPEGERPEVPLVMVCLRQTLLFVGQPPLASLSGLIFRWKVPHQDFAQEKRVWGGWVGLASNLQHRPGRPSPASMLGSRPSTPG